MDFAKITQKAKELWKKSVESSKSLSKKGIAVSKKAKNDVLSFTEDKLRDSRYIIKDADALKKLIDTSQEKKFTEKKTWISKTFIWRAVLFVCEDEAEFTTKLLYKLPMILAKSFSQNIYFWVLIWDSEHIDISKFKIKSKPTLLLFENMKIKKQIVWEENIQKVVNSLNLNINKTIDEL